MRAWARVLCANQTGQIAVRMPVTAAAAVLVRVFASLKTPSRAAAATMQTRVRVPLTTYPERCHQAARRMEGRVGWALVTVVCGIRAPVRKKSHAAGM